MMVQAYKAESGEVSVAGWTTKRDEHDWGRLARPEGIGQLKAIVNR
jgi:hypothetical protein